MTFVTKKNLYSKRTCKPCSKYHFSRGVANRIFSPIILPMRLRLGRLIMSFSSAYVFINSSISSREIAVFLKMGHISENFSLKWSGTWMSHSTQPNNVSFLIASRIVCSVIVCTLSKGHRRRAAMKRCNSLLVFFMARHSHSQHSTRLNPCLRI